MDRATRPEGLPLFRVPAVLSRDRPGSRRTAARTPGGGGTALCPVSEGLADEDAPRAPVRRSF